VSRSWSLTSEAGAGATAEPDDLDMVRPQLSPPISSREQRRTGHGG
jgi:hypothetical protein